MTNEFTVIGEHRENPLELLVLGADGGYYGYRLSHEDVLPVEPDENWIITTKPEPEDPEYMALPPARKPSSST